MKFSKTCCPTAKQQLEYHCEQHGYDCPDQVLRYYKNGAFILLAANASYVAKFCPWCGSKLKDFCIPEL
jgi:hypothetical protein